MRKTLLVAFSIIAFYSCGKKEKPQPVVEKTYYNHQYPDFSCNDKGDDGKFEQWEDTVEKTICSNCTFPDTANLRNVDSIAISGDSYSKSKKNFAVLYIKSKQKVQLKAFLVQKDNNHRYIWNEVVAPNRVFTQEIHVGGKLDSLKNGCTRLYYYLTEPTSVLVQTKGHFDIDVTD